MTVNLSGTPITAIGTTDSLGTVDLNLTVPSDAQVGFHDLNATFLGTPGSTGLIGDNATVKFVVLQIPTSRLQIALQLLLLEKPCMLMEHCWMTLACRCK